MAVPVVSAQRLSAPQRGQCAVDEGTGGVGSGMLALRDLLAMDCSGFAEPQAHGATKLTPFGGLVKVA